MMEYEVLVAADGPELEDMVKQRIREGWTVTGGVAMLQCASYRSYAQAMVREETQAAIASDFAVNHEIARELQLDVTAEEARALHRIVRAMHDGHCPKCGFLGRSDLFASVADRIDGRDKLNHKCPECGFLVTWQQAEVALDAFQPYLQRSVEVFERWLSGSK